MSPSVTQQANYLLYGNFPYNLFLDRDILTITAFSCQNTQKFS